MTREYSDKLKAWEKRRNEIVRLHKNGKTLREIGESFDPPISRQRIYQIIRRMGIKNMRQA